MAWASLNEQLRDVAAGFAGAPLENPAAVSVVLAQLASLVDGPFGSILDGVAPDPTGDEAEALGRTFALIAERLAALDARFQRRGGVAIWAAAQQVSAGCGLIACCLSVVRHAPTAEPGCFLQHCAQFLLRSGGKALRYAAAKRMDSGTITAVLGNQAPGLDHVLSRLADLSAPADCCVPPEMLHSWLAAAHTALGSAASPARAPGLPGVLAKQWGHLSHMLCVLCTSPAFRAHKQLLLGDERLCYGLLRLMLPSISAMAVGLQLPPERRPPECSWHSAEDMGAFITAIRPPASGVCQHIDHSGSGRLLQAAAQLVQHMPFDVASPPGERATMQPGFQSAVSLTYLLGWAGGLHNSIEVGHRKQGRAVDPARQGRLAQHVSAALPKLGGVLHAAVAAGLAGDEAHIACKSAHLTLLTLFWVLTPRERMSEFEGAARPRGAADVPGPALDIFPPPEIAGASELAAWSGGAATALAWLPCLASLAQQLSGWPSQPAGSTENCSPSDMDQLCRAELRLAYATAACAPAAESGALSGSNGEACVAAIWRLGTAACRLVHFVAAGGAQGLPSLSAEQPADAARHALLLLSTLDAAVYLKRRQDLPLSAEAQLGRCLPAFCLAHWEALQVVMERGGRAALGRELPIPDVVGALSLLITHGPSALAANLGVQEMLSMAVGRLPQGEALQVCIAFRLLDPRPGCNVPQLTAVLLASGLLEAAARDLAAMSRKSNDAATAAQIVAAGIVPMLQHLLEALEDVRGGALDATLAVAREIQAALGTAVSGATAQRVSRDVQHNILSALPSCRHGAALLLDWWRRPEAQPAAALELAQAAAARSCAYLRCANLGCEGGPAAGQGAGSQRCSACRAVWYCGTACSHAGWRAGHRRICRVLGAARAAEKEQRRQAAAAAAEHAQ